MEVWILNETQDNRTLQYQMEPCVCVCHAQIYVCVSLSDSVSFRRYLVNYLSRIVEPSCYVAKSATATRLRRFDDQVGENTFILQLR